MAVGPGLVGVLVPLLKGGKEQGQGIGVLDTMRANMGYREG